MALGTYNRMRANLGGGVMRYAERYAFNASLMASADVSVSYPFLHRFVGEMAADFNLWWGYDEKYTFTGSLEAIAAPHIAVRPGYILSGALDAAASPSIPLLYRMSGQLTAGSKAYIAVRPPWGVFSGSLAAFLSSAQTREKIMTLSGIRIPAGGKLVIDSANRLILLNGGSVIDLYAGDWFSFTPDLLGLDVFSGTSAIPGVSVLYTEKFL